MKIPIPYVSFEPTKRQGDQLEACNEVFPLNVLSYPRWVHTAFDLEIS